MARLERFTDPLLVQIEQGEERGRGLATLKAPFRYDVGRLGSGDTITVPAEFRTDFCSSPWWMRWAVSNFDGLAKAAVVHDWLWSEAPPARRPRREIDRIYREALAVLGASLPRRWIMWAGVRFQAFLTGDR